MQGKQLMQVMGHGPTGSCMHGSAAKRVAWPVGPLLLLSSPCTDCLGGMGAQLQRQLTSHAVIQQLHTYSLGTVKLGHMVQSMCIALLLSCLLGACCFVLRHVSALLTSYVLSCKQANRRSFQQEPIGPIGAYIKLRDSKWVMIDSIVWCTL